MKNKVINKICSLALALVMAMTIISTTAFAEETKRIVKVTLPDTLQLVADSGALEQDLTNGAEFKSIVIEPKKGYKFDDITKIIDALNNGDLKDTNLEAKIISPNTYQLHIALVSGKSSSDVQSTEVNSNNFKVLETYVMYAGTSVVGATGDDNKMNAQYDAITGKLTFDCPRTGVLEFYDANGKKTYYNPFTRFYVRVYTNLNDNVSYTNVVEFNLGEGSDSTAPDTNYASSTTINPYINLKKLINDRSEYYKDKDLYIDIIPCSEKAAISVNSVYFTIKINALTIAPVISVELPEGLKKADGSGELVQAITEGKTFTPIILDPKSGYAFTASTATKLNELLADKNLTASLSLENQTLTISTADTSKAVLDTTVSATDFDLTQTYIMYNDKFSKVGQTGENNKMNAKYDSSTGKLTFDCARTGSLEYYNEQSERLDYTNFSRFYVTVYTSDENGSIEDGSKLVEFNLGDSSSDATKPDTNYASSTTVDPYINLKKVIQEKGSKLSSSSLVWVKVRACTGAAMIGRGNVFFKIRVGTVEEILKESSSDSSSKKSSGGWDDGGPFTTDTCGNVFDRWGNMIYEAKGCNVGGYNLVRTSVED